MYQTSKNMATLDFLGILLSDSESKIVAYLLVGSDLGWWGAQSSSVSTSGHSIHFYNFVDSA